jgi:hypothetical protein
VARVELPHADSALIHTEAITAIHGFTVLTGQDEIYIVTALRGTAVIGPLSVLEHGLLKPIARRLHDLANPVRPGRLERRAYGGE